MSFRATARCRMDTAQSREFVNALRDCLGKEPLYGEADLPRTFGRQLRTKEELDAWRFYPMPFAEPRWMR